MLFPVLVPRFVVAVDARNRAHPVVEDEGFRIQSAWWGEDTQLRTTDLDSDRSLVLLGEPGVGKSVTIASLVGGGPLVDVDLVQATDAGMLRELLGLPSHGPADGSRTTLVLDGVDECPLNPKVLLRHVVEAVGRQPGIRVLVGCRTADWLADLEQGLRAVLGALDVYELLPLSREDVLALATSCGTDGPAFVAAVERVGAGPLAGVPLTLKLLLDLYEQEGGLPSSARDIYEEGLLLLAGEPSPHHHGRAGSDVERLAVAARIAAALGLCGRGVISTRGRHRPNEVQAGDLSGGHEPLPSGEIDVRAEMIAATLSTALFSGRGAGRFGVSHASFAAYLTARFLVSHAVPEHQLRSLLTRTSTLGTTSVPTHLRETVAWLMGIDPDRQRWVLEVDPGSVLPHSSLISDPRVRSALVTTLLEAGDEDGASPRRRWRLGHPGLAGQLDRALRAPLSEDAGPHFGHPVSRRAGTAIEIARASEERGVLHRLVDLATAKSLNSYLRSSAAHALLSLDGELASAALRGVLDEVSAQPDNDPEDELRGVALRACWPATLTVRELLATLTAPQRTDYFGSYQYFLGQFVRSLTDDRLAEVTREVARSGTAATVDPKLVAEFELEPGVLLLGGGRRDERLVMELLHRVLDSDVLPALVDEAGWLVAQAVSQHQHMTLPTRFHLGVGEDEHQDVRDLRRALVLAVLPHLDSVWCPWLIYRWTVAAPGRAVLGLVRPDDLDWLFGLAGGPHEDRAAVLVRTVFDDTDPRQQEIAWGHRATPMFQTALGRRFEAVLIAGPAADRMREEHGWIDPAPAWEGAADHPVALADAVGRCRAGDASAFAELCRLLRTDPRTGRVDDIGQWPGAQDLDVDPDGLLAWAWAYLALPVETSDLAGNGSYTRRAREGYAALALLVRRGHNAFAPAAVPVETWVRWAPAVVRCSGFGPEDSEEIKKQLMTWVSNRAPDAFVDAYLGWVEYSFRRSDFLPDLSPLDTGYTTAIGDRLAPLVNAQIKVLVPHSLPRSISRSTVRDRVDEQDRERRATQELGELGDFLCRHGHAATISRLEAVLQPLPGAEKAPADARAVAAISLLVPGIVSWSVISPIVEAEADFGRAVVSSLARRADDGAELLHQLSDDQIATLWRRAGDVMSDDEVANGTTEGWIERPEERFRQTLLAHLAARRTPTALDALAALTAGHPDEPGLTRWVREAERHQQDEAEHHPTVAELMTLVADARRTVVLDDDDLFRLVSDVLGRAQSRLGSYGQFLWNETRSKDDRTSWVWRPKYEPDVSAFLQDHLESELSQHLVVNREVLVKQTTSKGHGLSVDVLAGGASTGARVVRMPRCPIEVKGNWNRGLLTDLEKQLVADYMPALGTTRGVFVCAWFPVDLWTDERDERRTTARARDRAEVQRLLQVAADRASDGGRIKVSVLVLEVPRPAPSAIALSSNDHSAGGPPC